MLGIRVLCDGLSNNKIKKASTKLAFNYLFLKKLQQFNRLLGDHEFFVSWVSISIASARRDLDPSSLRYC